MASTDQLDLLKDFRGSEEEDTVKRVLKIITTETVSPSPAFVNLVIKNSNALDGTSFNDAYISLQPSYESMKAFESDYRRGYPKLGLVYIKDILNISILEEFLAHGVDTFGKCPQPDVCWQAFLTLFNFLREKRHHEEAIKKLLSTATHSINSNKETQIMAGLAHHLFSQLIPGRTYEVDRYADQLSNECDCGCKAKICEGDTSIGSWRTWHGRIDIMLNQAIAVSFPGKEQTDDSEDDNTDGDGPVEVTQRHDSVLLDQKVFRKIMAETITNGFAQVNKDRNSLSHFFIPTFGTTSDHVSVCLYDPESDCLLHIRDPLQLWCSDQTPDRLNVSTIVVIWLFLNFMIFTQKKLSAVVDLDKSGLHESLKQHLEYYRKAETKRNLVLGTPDGPPWKHVYLQPKRRKTQV